MDSGCLQLQRGVSLIEVLITVFVLAIGMLGLAGLQLSTLNSQFESYQRAQALLLVEEMASRIRVNSIAAMASSYPDGTAYGLAPEEEEAVCDAKATTAERDLCDWNNILAGASVKTPADESLGGIVGARGCIENVAGSLDGEATVRVTVAWQGLSATSAPASICGENAYGDDDSYRRTASVLVVLADLGA